MLRGLFALSFLILALTAFQFSSKPKIIKMVMANFTYCVLFDNGKVKCWGDNRTGVLGLENTINVGDYKGSMASLPYVKIGEEIGKKDEYVVDIVAGAYHVCVLFETNKVKCWGENSGGMLGIGVTIDSSARNSMGGRPNEMRDLPYVLIGEEIGRKDEKISKLFAGAFHTCALFENNKVKCWGRGEAGELGIDANQNVGETPEGMASLPYVKIGSEIGREDEVVKDMFLGDGTTCALFENGKAKCWGFNASGQLGIETTENTGDQENEMEQLPYLKLGVEVGHDEDKIRKIIHNYHLGCALFENGRAKCWGRDSFGDLGLGLNGESIGVQPGEMEKLPYILVGESIGVKNEKIMDMNIGGLHTCALFDSGKMKCWGRNNYAQLGLGDLRREIGQTPKDFTNLAYVYIGAEANVPEDVPVQVECGGANTCVRYENGKIQCWGENRFGQLGVDDNVTRGFLLIDEEGVMSPYVKL